MDSLKQSFYLISNGSEETYPENTLVEFKNKLPITIETDRNEGLEIALTSIGISNTFKNISVPPNGLPSFLITNCFPTAGQCLNENIRGTQSGPNDYHACALPDNFVLPDLLLNDLEEKNEIYDHYVGVHSYDRSGGIKVDCRFYPFFFEDRCYSKNELKDYFKNVTRIAGLETSCNIIFDDDCRLFVETKAADFWFIMHTSMVKCFNFKNTFAFEAEPNLQMVTMDSKDNIDIDVSRYLRKMWIKDEEYYVYRIRTNPFDIKNSDYIISGIENNVLEKKFPSIIRVVCENITPQIFNNSFSKDLIVFCPDFKNNEEYTSMEFTAKQYVPVSNSIIDSISIKLVDEKNKPITLLPGPATILRMDLRNRFLNKKTFNVRLTSEKNVEYPDNNNSSFKITLPSPLSVNRNWRVSLTSISNPNVFSTFLKDEETRGIFIKELGTNKYLKSFMPEPEKIYSDQEIVSFLDKELKESGIGSLQKEDGKCVFTFKQNEILLIVSNNLLKIIGYDGLINEKSKVTKLVVVKNVADYNLRKNKINSDFILKMTDSNELRFNEGFKMDYLKPNYLMVYSNIVSRTIVGSTMSNILKVVPIRTTKENYVISDFKHKEFYELQNTEIETIAIDIRSHDGEPINFGSKDNIILNLEFSNYLEITR